jgi:hypothetical protein
MHSSSNVIVNQFPFLSATIKKLPNNTLYFICVLLLIWLSYSIYKYFIFISTFT